MLDAISTREFATTLQSSLDLSVEFYKYEAAISLWRCHWRCCWRCLEIDEVLILIRLLASICRRIHRASPQFLQCHHRKVWFQLWSIQRKLAAIVGSKPGDGGRLAILDTILMANSKYNVRLTKIT